MDDVTSGELSAIAAVNGSFMAADAKDFDAYRSFYADELEVDFGGVNADASGTVRADDLRRSAERLVGPVTLTQHMISNHVVTIAGGLASVTYYEQALHVHPALGDDPAVNTWTLYGRGEHRLRRTEDGWKIVYTRLVPVHSAGNPDLLADVAESLR
jgi:ketosteroid isomerase-like protein